MAPGKAAKSVFVREVMSMGRGCAVCALALPQGAQLDPLCDPAAPLRSRPLGFVAWLRGDPHAVRVGGVDGCPLGRGGGGGGSRYDHMLVR